MNKLQQQVIESCIDTRDVFDQKKLSTKSYSDEMERRRQEEQLIMEARIRNIKKNYQQKYESLHQTYLYQSEQLKQQLQSEIKKEMYSFEKKMETYLKQISENDKKLNRSGYSLGHSHNYNSLSQQLNNISQTLCTEQTLNQSSVNDLFNFVESHDNSLFNKNQQNQSYLQYQSSIATFNNQPTSFRGTPTTHNNNNTHATRILLTEDDFNDQYPNKGQHLNEAWNKENQLDQSNSFMARHQKSKSILKNNQQLNSAYFKNNENTSSLRSKYDKNESKRVLQTNQNRDNTHQGYKSKNWDTIKQIRQQIKEQSQSPRSSSFAAGYKRTEKCLSTNGDRTKYSTHDREEQKMYDKNKRMNRSFQIPNKENTFNLNNQCHNLSFTNLNQFENGSSYNRYNSVSSSDSESDRHLDTDRLKRFKIDNINLIKSIKSNQNKVSQNSYYYK